jgi:hypothetical protein
MRSNMSPVLERSGECPACRSAVAGLGEIRRVPCVSLGVDILQGDLAARLPVIRDEALGLVPREVGIHHEDPLGSLFCRDLNWVSTESGDLGRSRFRTR